MSFEKNVMGSIYLSRLLEDTLNHSLRVNVEIVKDCRDPNAVTTLMAEIVVAVIDGRMSLEFRSFELYFDPELEICDQVSVSILSEAGFEAIARYTARFYTPGNDADPFGEAVFIVAPWQ